MAAVPVADPEHRHAQRVLLQDEMPSNIRKRGETTGAWRCVRWVPVICRTTASGQCILAVITYNSQENTMVPFVARKWLLAASVTAALAAAPRSQRKTWWWLWGLTSRRWIRMTLTTPFLRRWQNPSTGAVRLDREMKLKNVLAEGYTVSDDGLVYTVKLRTGVKFGTAPTSTPRRLRSTGPSQQSGKRS